MASVGVNTSVRPVEIDVEVGADTPLCPYLSTIMLLNKLMIITRHKCLKALVIAVLLTGCSRPVQPNETLVGNSDTLAVELPADAVPFSYRRYICFDVMLRDSVSARMIFDTGANNMLLDSAFYAYYFAANGNLRKAVLGGAGNGMEMANIDASGWSYRVGNKSHTEQMTVVLNLRKIVGDDVDGLFGLPFMQGERVEFNYADGYMRFLTAGEEIANDFMRVDCKWLGNKKERIILPLSITFADGYTFNGDFLLDTGMPGTLSLNSTTAKKLKAKGVLDDAGKFVYTVGGIGGSAVQNDICASRITVGGYALNDVRINWSENSLGSLADDSYSGLVGNGLFERFDVVFDFVEWVIYLRPNRNFAAPQPNYFGIAFTPMADHWIVNGLLEGGNAEKAGLRRGDRIEAINGIKATDSNASSLYPLPEKLTLTVMRDGKIVEISVHKE